MIDVQRGNIYLADLPMPSSIFNEFKTRPVLVIQNNKLNLSRSDTIIIPISSNLKHSGEYTNYTFDNFQELGLRVKSVGICSSILTIPKSIIKRYIGKITQNQMDTIIQKTLFCIQEDWET